jgi:O-antigen ligase
MSILFSVFVDHKKQNQWFVLFFSFSLLGLFFGKPALLSIGMIGLIIPFLLTQFWQQMEWTFYEKILFSFAPIFLMYIIGGLWTVEMDYWIDRVQVKLPLLFMPFAFVFYKKIITERTLKNVSIIYLLLCVITIFYSLGMYAIHFDAINESYKHAKTLPTTLGHIRYSLVLAIGFFIAVRLYLLHNRNIFYLLSMLLIVVYLHIFSVRSGLLALYAGSGFWLLKYVVESKKYVYLWVIPITMMMLLIAYFYVPTLNNKVNYMKRDISRYINGESVNDFSDGNRLLSIQLGLELFKENPWLGVGSGDLQKEMSKKYQIGYPDILERNYLIPHNQFVYVIAALGGLGFICFMVFVFYPLAFKQVWSYPLFLLLLIVCYTSFISEATIEVQDGVALMSLLYGYVLLFDFTLTNNKQ